MSFSCKCEHILIRAPIQSLSKTPNRRLSINTVTQCISLKANSYHCKKFNCTLITVYKNLWFILLLRATSGRKTVYTFESKEIKNIPISIVYKWYHIVSKDVIFR